jgi:hypothetical protein
MHQDHRVKDRVLFPRVSLSSWGNHDGDRDGVVTPCSLWFDCHVQSSNRFPSIHSLLSLYLPFFVYWQSTTSWLSALSQQYKHITSNPRMRRTDYPQLDGTANYGSRHTRVSKWWSYLRRGIPIRTRSLGPPSPPSYPAVVLTSSNSPTGPLFESSPPQDHSCILAKGTWLRCFACWVMLRSYLEIETETVFLHRSCLIRAFPCASPFFHIFSIAETDSSRLNFVRISFNERPLIFWVPRHPRRLDVLVRANAFLGRHVLRGH